MSLHMQLLGKNDLNYTGIFFCIYAFTFHVLNVKSKMFLTSKTKQYLEHLLFLILIIVK